MAYSAEELQEMYPDTTTRTNILRLAGIGRLLGESIVVPRYKIPTHLHEPLVFTEAGEKWIRDLSSSRSANWGERRLAVFLELYHDELFIDPNRTDIAALRAGLSQEIKNGNIIYPFIWGRELYEKAYEQIPQAHLHSLDSKRTLDFLSGTPKGVFQSTDTLVGPWGALQSAEYRYIQPTRSPRLYHCERPGCLRAHQTQLTTSDNLILTVRNRLGKKLFHASVSNWSKFLSELNLRLSGYYDDSRTMDIAGLLTECFSDAELKTIAATALGDRSLELRKICSTAGINIRDAEDFLRDLSKAEISQLLLLLPDKGIISAIDSSVRVGAVRVPSGEVRTPRLNGRTSGNFDVSLQCSSRGVRVHSGNAWTPIRRLRRLIREVYSGPSYESHLKWKIRDVEAGNDEEKLDRYIATSEIHDIIRDLFLSGPDVFRKAAGVIGLPEDSSRSDREFASDFTWKLGFPLDLDDDGVSELRKNAKDLRGAAVEFSNHGEERKRVIRSFSPNLFVALEEALDRSLAFATWLTTVDHWTETPRFTFVRDEARRHMAGILSSYSTSKGDPVIFSSSGVNTLFPLISGFGLLASYLENESAHVDKYKRPDSEIPQAFRESDMATFGYRSRMPFLNFSEEARARLVQTLRSVSRELSTGQVSTVRNGLEHHKERFPDQNSILDCVDSILRVCDIVEGFGIFPIAFKMKSFIRDSEGRAQYLYEDYSGRGVKISAPSSVVVTGGPGWHQNQIIVPGLIVGGPSWVPRFISGVRSEFTEMWHDWPRVRALSSNFIEVQEVINGNGDDEALENVEPSGL
ncbi:hypothetical protein [Streptomyces pseudogriseolus]|uniref:hypothetical protein n=1 Tax=Streptomyces pseudogriseolus TaxID=36817 RepID=UPI003FA2589F